MKWVSRRGPSDATCRIATSAGRSPPADGTGHAYRTTSAVSSSIVVAARSRATRRVSRRIARSTSATAAPWAGTKRSTTLAVSPYGLRSAPGPDMSTRESGNSSGPTKPAPNRSQALMTATPRRRLVRPDPAASSAPSTPGNDDDGSEALAEGSTTSRTLEIRTGSPGRTTSTVASASAGSPAPTASCEVDTVSVAPSRPVCVPSTILSTSNVAISRSATVDDTVDSLPEEGTDRQRRES